MSESLRQKQSRFAKDAARLILRAYELGYEITLGEAWRTPQQAKANAKSGAGIANSLHIERLAIDLNLFRDGKFLTDSAAHRPLGEWWESLGHDYKWGGRFKDSNGHPRPDGNHYSISPDGRRA